MNEVLVGARRARVGLVVLLCWLVCSMAQVVNVLWSAHQIREELRECVRSTHLQRRHVEEAIGAVCKQKGFEMLGSTIRWEVVGTWRRGEVVVQKTTPFGAVFLVELRFHLISEFPNF